MSMLVRLNEIAKQIDEHGTFTTPDIDVLKRAQIDPYELYDDWVGGKNHRYGNKQRSELIDWMKAKGYLTVLDRRIECTNAAFDYAEELLKASSSLDNFCRKMNLSHSLPT
jgi:hypothetical protein